MSEIDKTVEFLIDSVNPGALDKVLNSMGAVMLQSASGEYQKIEGHYVARVLGGDVNYVKFACKNQGYGKLVESADTPNSDGDDNE